MVQKSAHEPAAPVMSAADVWNDALNLAEILRHNLLRSEPMVRLQVPFSLFLSALEEFNREELVLLQRRVEERLAA
jgi:uncharacterized linocin/CFP29 family protein